MDWQAGLTTVEILILDFRTSKNETDKLLFWEKIWCSTNWIGKLASLQSRLDFDNDWQLYKNTLLEKESFNISKYAQNTTLFLHVNWRPKLVIMTFEIFIHGQKCSGLPQTYICSTLQYEWNWNAHFQYVILLTFSNIYFLSKFPELPQTCICSTWLWRTLPHSS